MFRFKKFLLESKKSDDYEKAVADSINQIEGISAERPKVSTAYSDVRLTKDGKTTWLEVKMNHTDNLSNPRVFFDGRKWATTYKTTAAKVIVDELNKSSETKQFLADISKFSGIDKPQIPTTKTGLKHPNAVPLDVMKEYFSQPGVNRYIMTIENYDLGKVVEDHYLIGKKEPAHYMQAGDDFYLIGTKNPFGLSRDIPQMKGIGPLKVRIGTRSKFYEVQAEIKIVKMPSSKYSLMPGTKKKNPFS